MTSARFPAAARYAIFALMAATVQMLLVWGPEKMHTALFFDCAVTVPAAYWFLLVRSGQRGRASLILIAALSLLRGACLLSPRLATATAIAAEGAIVVLLLSRARRLDQLLPSKTLARVLQSEIDVLRYAFASAPRVDAKAKAFTIHEASGGAALFWLLAAVTPVEAGALHLIVHAKWVWIATALSLYSAVWMIAIARSFDALPITVDSEGVTLRRGILATLRIPKDAITSISNSASGMKKPARFAVLADPTVWIQFERPLTLQLPFGFTRQVEAAAIAPDQPAQFRAALSELNLDSAE